MSFLIAHAMFKFVGLSVAQPRQTAGSVVRAVPTLPEADIKALDSIRTSGLFTLEKSAGMYARVTRLRPQNNQRQMVRAALTNY